MKLGYITDPQKRGLGGPEQTTKHHLQQNPIPCIIDTLQRRINIHLPLIDQINHVLLKS